MTPKRDTFGGRAAVIMAFAGTAIGLGNIWRFPYMVGQYGGAAFILIYIIASLLISLPIFIGESIIGRSSGQNAIGAIKTLAPGSKWNILGYLSIITPMIVVSYYSVVGGWSLEYLYKACTFSFTAAPPELMTGLFDQFNRSAWPPILCHTIFLGLSCAIVSAGVKYGIEKFSKVSIPILFALIILIVAYSVSLPGAKEGIDYLVHPDFSKITPKTCAFALGQSFFSLSLGMGIIITYASYVGKKENLLVSGVGTALSDLIFAILAGFAIMPAVFAAGIEPNSGPSLIFQTLPYIFSKMSATLPWLSSIAAIFFFLTVTVAALTSSVSLIEVGVAWLVEEKHFKRSTASLTVFFVTWILGVIASLSFGPLSNVKIFSRQIFDFMDMLSSNILMTLGALLGVLFVGWGMSKKQVRDEFTNGGTLKFNAACFDSLYFILRFIAPVGIIIILITNFIG